jgi:hypothetical protein
MSWLPPVSVPATEDGVTVHEQRLEDMITVVKTPLCKDSVGVRDTGRRLLTK